MGDERRPGGGDVKSASRTLDVLEALGRDGGRYTLGELADRLAIPRSSLHALLHTMQRRGWVQAEGDLRYGLGLRALRVGTAFVDGDAVVATVAPILDRLVAELDETVHHGRIDGADVVYLAKRESTHPLRLFSAVGRRLPAHATALGKAILAHLPPDEVDRELHWPLTRLTPATIVTAEALHDELDRVREQGYAVDRQENADGIHCVAVALPRPHPARDAISCSVPVVRMGEQREREVIAALVAARDTLAPRRGTANG